MYIFRRLKQCLTWLCYLQAYVPTIVRNWAVYIPTQIVNFAFTPPHLRLVVVSVVSLFWSKYWTIPSLLRLSCWISILYPFIGPFLFLLLSSDFPWSWFLIVHSLFRYVSECCECGKCKSSTGSWRRGKCEDRGGGWEGRLCLSMYL